MRHRRHRWGDASATARSQPPGGGTAGPGACLPGSGRPGTTRSARTVLRDHNPVGLEPGLLGAGPFGLRSVPLAPYAPPRATRCGLGRVPGRRHGRARHRGDRPRHGLSGHRRPTDQPGEAGSTGSGAAGQLQCPLRAVRSELPAVLRRDVLRPERPQLRHHRRMGAELLRRGPRRLLRRGVRRPPLRPEPLPGVCSNAARRGRSAAMAAACNTSSTPRTADAAATFAPVERPARPESASARPAIHGSATCP